MINKVEIFNKTQLKKDLPDIRPGDTIRVFQKIKETPKKTGQEDKERIQVFEGLVIARKHGKGVSATITVRKVISGIGVEKVFPIHSPTIEKIKILKRGKVKRAKLYYLRTAKGKKARLKRKEFVEVIDETTSAPADAEALADKESTAGKEEKIVEEKPVEEVKKEEKESKKESE